MSQATDQFLLLCDEPRHGLAASIDADPLGHVQSEEIARFQERVDRLEIDVVGVDEVRAGPTASPHGAVGLAPDVGRAAADDRVLAVRLVPDGSNVTPWRRAIN